MKRAETCFHVVYIHVALKGLKNFYTCNSKVDLTFFLYYQMLCIST